MEPKISILIQADSSNMKFRDPNLGRTLVQIYVWFRWDLVLYSNSL